MRNALVAPDILLAYHKLVLKAMTGGIAII